MNLFDDEAIAKWWRTRPPAFKEWLSEQQYRILNELIAADNLVAISRCQGRLEVYHLLERLGIDDMGPVSFAGILKEKL